MMYDKRVVRGGAQHGGAGAPSEQRQRRAGDSHRSRDADAHGGVAPVAGRAHSEIQTETYLEVLTDRAPEEECGVQTDMALNRPPAPLFVPAPVRGAPLARGLQPKTRAQSHTPHCARSLPPFFSPPLCSRALTP